MTERRSPGTSTPPDDPAVAEVRRFHGALALWLAAGEADAFAAIEGAIHESLTLIDQDGDQVSGAELLTALGRAGGSRPGLAIDVSEIEVILRVEGGTVVTFCERHSTDGERARRRTTGLLLADPDRPGVLLWRHVHETAVSS